MHRSALYAAGAVLAVLTVGSTAARADRDWDHGRGWHGGRSYWGPTYYAAPPVYYAAGPEAFVKAMRAALAAAHVGEDDIRTEEFPGY